MSREYEPPTVETYGSVEALTRAHGNKDHLGSDADIDATILQGSDPFAPHL